jgi:hypothetical protein
MYLPHNILLSCPFCLPRQRASPACPVDADPCSPHACLIINIQWFCVYVLACPVWLSKVPVQSCPPCPANLYGNLLLRWTSSVYNILLGNFVFPRACHQSVRLRNTILLYALCFITRIKLTKETRRRVLTWEGRIRDGGIGEGGCKRDYSLF